MSFPTYAGEDGVKQSLGLTVWMNLLHITFLSPLQKNINKNDYQQHYTFWSPYWLYTVWFDIAKHRPMKVCVLLVYHNFSQKIKKTASF